MKKQMMLWTLIGLTTFLFVTLFIPALLVNKAHIANPGAEAVPDPLETLPESQDPPLYVSIYLTGEKRIEKVPLEIYVRGVVAAEMPAEFDIEALKAQAIAARTYIVRRMVESDTSNVPVEGAVVTDSVVHQAYLTERRMKTQWGQQKYTKNMKKLNRAVNETRGLIATYQHQPIIAAFFSTSNGYTENSEDYWAEAIPYLRSVPSPWDRKLSPKYTATVSLSAGELLRKLGNQDTATVSASAATPNMQILERTAGHRVKDIRIGRTVYTGREVREKLGLNSSGFTWKWAGSKVQFTTAGYGHGIGMSQWGAAGMAQEGKTAEEILKYYYRGIAVEPASRLHAGGQL